MSKGRTIEIENPEDFSSWPEAHVGECCRCGKTAKQVFCKNGKNRGKEFYGCPEPKSTSCGYFSWGGIYRKTVPPAAGSSKRSAESDLSGESTKRLCSIEENQSEIKSMLMGVQNQLIKIEELLQKQ